MIFRKKKEGPKPEDYRASVQLAGSLMKKSVSERSVPKQVEIYWKILETLSAPGETEKPKWGAVFRRLEPHLAEIPHGIREEILLDPGVQRLSNLSPTLSGAQNMLLCDVHAAEFQKAKSRLNRYRGHIGGSSAHTLEGLQAVFLYLVLFAGLCRLEGEKHWIHDSLESVEPVAKNLTASMLQIFEKKHGGGRE